MLWGWFRALTGQQSHSAAMDALPPLEKAAEAAADRHPEQQRFAALQQKEYCLRMAFKLAPKYSSKLQARVRWLKVLRAAQQPAGGSWDPDFCAQDMNPRRLKQLADVIDATFLNGSFAEVCGPSYSVQDSRLAPEEAGAGCDRRACRHATAGFEPSSNTIFFYRPSWRRAPSLYCPLQADGVVCTNKLSWLAHTMGHEMVHAIVHHACPETRDKQSYTQNHGHGPVFEQLNRHIFGHHTTRYKAGWGRLRPHLQVQPLTVTHSLQQKQECRSEEGGVSSEQELGWDVTGAGAGAAAQQQQQQVLSQHSAWFQDEDSLEQQQQQQQKQQVPAVCSALPSWTRPPLGPH